jgi:hypothetical protein
VPETGSWDCITMAFPPLAVTQSHPAFPSTELDRQSTACLSTTSRTETLQTWGLFLLPHPQPQVDEQVCWGKAPRATQKFVTPSSGAECSLRLFPGGPVLHSAHLCSVASSAQPSALFLSSFTRKQKKMPSLSQLRVPGRVGSHPLWPHPCGSTPAPQISF